MPASAMLKRGSTTICLVKRWVVVADQTSMTSIQKSCFGSFLALVALTNSLRRLLEGRWAVVDVEVGQILSSRCLPKPWMVVGAAEAVLVCTRWDPVPSLSPLVDRWHKECRFNNFRLGHGKDVDSSSRYTGKIQMTMVVKSLKFAKMRMIDKMVTLMILQMHSLMAFVEVMKMAGVNSQTNLSTWKKSVKRYALNAVLEHLSYST